MLVYLGKEEISDSSSTKLNRRGQAVGLEPSAIFRINWSRRLHRYSLFYIYEQHNNPNNSIMGSIHHDNTLAHNKPCGTLGLSNYYTWDFNVK